MQNLKNQPIPEDGAPRSEVDIVGIVCHKQSGYICGRRRGQKLPFQKRDRSSSNTNARVDMSASVEEQRTQLEAAKEMIESQNSELETAKSKINDQQIQLEVAELKMKDQQSQLEECQLEVQSNRNEIQDLKTEMNLLRQQFFGKFSSPNGSYN